MQIFVELGNVKLEPDDLNGKECHLNKVAEAHWFKPNPKSKFMGSYSFRGQALVIESISFLKVTLITDFTEFEVPESCTALKKAATDVYFRNPGVLNDPICNFGLHGFEHAIFRHQSQRSKIVRIPLLKE